MSPNPQETAGMVTFTEEILNERLYFLCSSFQYRCVRACIPIYVRSVFCVLPLFYIYLKTVKKCVLNTLTPVTEKIINT